MPLPIIIIIENHCDVELKQTITHCLPFLASLGYNKLCFESASDVNQAKTISDLEDTITFVTEQLTIAYQFLGKQGILKNLPAMDYHDLKELLHLYVSSKHSHAMASWFNELPAQKEKISIIQKALELGINICGIDLPEKELEPLTCLEAFGDLTIKNKAIDQLDDSRIDSFMKHMLQMQQEGNGVVFLVGLLHYEKLAQAFMVDNRLGEVIFLHPHPSKSISRVLNLYLAPPLHLKAGYEELSLLEHEIFSKDDMPLFLASLKTLLINKIDSYRLIEQTTSCAILNETSNLTFTPYQRPSKLVDCIHLLSGDENILQKVNHLSAKGINGYFTLFRDKSAYCIPSINSEKVASSISQLKK